MVRNKSVNIIRQCFIILAAAGALLASTQNDSLAQPADSTDSLPQPCKIVMNISGKDIYETLLVSTSKDTFNDTLISFKTHDSLIIVSLDYSGFKQVPKIKIQFYNNTVLIDSSKAQGVHIVSKYKPESRALLMKISLAPAGWTTLIQCDSAFSGVPSPLTLNARKSPRSLGKNRIRLPLNRYDINAVVVTPQKQYRTGSLLIDFPNPYGPPSILEAIDMNAKLSLDKEKNRAVITVRFLPRTATITFITKVMYAQGCIRNVKTGDQIDIALTTGRDSLELACQNTYECIFRKPGFNPLRKVITVAENDTAYTFTWYAFDSQPILLRSLALPGLGQYYSERERWWIWPAASGVSACITGIAYLAMINAKNDFNEYNDKYLDEPNEFARKNYDDKRRDALGSLQSSSNVFIVSLATLGVVWAANIGDAFFFSIGPKTKVTVSPIPGKRNIVIDF